MLLSLRYNFFMFLSTTFFFFSKYGGLVLLIRYSYSMVFSVADISEYMVLVAAARLTGPTLVNMPLYFQLKLE